MKIAPNLRRFLSCLPFTNRSLSSLLFTSPSLFTDYSTSPFSLLFPYSHICMDSVYHWIPSSFPTLSSLCTLSCTLLVFISIQSLQFIPFQMFFNRFRFLLCIVSFFALASIYSNQIIINFTFICMTNDANDTITLSDGVRCSILQLLNMYLHQSVRQRYDYSTKEKSMILSSIGIGTMLATFPITHLIAKVGAR